MGNIPHELLPLLQANSKDRTADCKLTKFHRPDVVLASPAAYLSALLRFEIMCPNLSLFGSEAETSPANLVIKIRVTKDDTNSEVAQQVNPYLLGRTE